MVTFSWGNSFPSNNNSKVFLALILGEQNTCEICFGSNNLPGPTTLGPKALIVSCDYGRRKWNLILVNCSL